MPFFRRVSTGIAYYTPNDLELPTFTPITEAEAGPDVQGVPTSISLRQFKLGVLAQGQLGEIDRAVKRDDSPEGKAMQIEWALAESLARDSDLTLAFCTIVSMNDANIDEAFIVGGAL